MLGGHALSVGAAGLHGDVRGPYTGERGQLVIRHLPTLGAHAQATPQAPTA